MLKCYDLHFFISASSLPVPRLSFKCQSQLNAFLKKKSACVAQLTAFEDIKPCTCSVTIGSAMGCAWMFSLRSIYQNIIQLLQCSRRDMQCGYLELADSGPIKHFSSCFFEVLIPYRQIINPVRLNCIREEVFLLLIISQCLI